MTVGGGSMRRVDLVFRVFCHFHLRMGYGFLAKCKLMIG